jgi:hypothetical protein
VDDRTVVLVHHTAHRTTRVQVPGSEPVTVPEPDGAQGVRDTADLYMIIGYDVTIRWTTGG